MIITKRRLLQLEMPYAIRTVKIAGVEHLLMSTEGYGPVFLASPPGWRPVRIANGPGGVMAFSRPVGKEGSIYVIMGCFPGFQFHGAGIYRLRPTKGLTEMWAQDRVLDLPFAHRLEVVRCKDRDVLVAASVAQTKDSPEDWVRPGAVYACPLEGDATRQKWNLLPVFENLHKNHGFLNADDAATPSVLVSGSEGVFRLQIRPETGSPWHADRLLDREVSEFALLDLNGDGVDEMVTVEGFHGNALRVYEPQQNTWKERVSFDIVSAHGLWAGRILGSPAFICGSRGGDLALKLYLSRKAAALSFEEVILDENTSPVNIAVVNNGDEDLVFTTNQRSNEVALYRLSR